jgi:hypothetical protein
LVNVWLTPECRSEHRFVGVRDYGKPVASENSVVGQLNKADKTDYWWAVVRASVPSARSLNPAGGPVGSRHRQQLTGEFIAALLRDFRQGGPKAIERVRRTQPAAYLKILALLVPREHKVEHRNLVASLTDEELDAAIEAIQKMLATQAENAKVIEGTTAPMALPVPTEPEQPGRKRSNRLLQHVDTAIGPSERGKRKP